ncbi:MAG TPA: serine/threonine-protein kinase [Myxococcales bacterium]|nr:serine/threonine-protein kinase [Myxococcales bacterium]
MSAGGQPGAHPEPAVLERLARDQLPAEEADRVRAHAGGCSECSRRLFQLSTGAGEGDPRDQEATAFQPPSAPLLAAAAEPAPDPLAQLPRGSSIGRYVVLDRIGSGGMGVVYAAFDRELDRKVAIKLLQSGPGSAGSATSPSATSGGQQLLLREAQAMARLSHPNVLAVHDVGVWSERVFVAMELVEGHSLRQRLKAGPLPWREALRVMEAAGEGLAAAHHKGLVHRDFKADNILIGQDGRVQVMDFGLARAAKDRAPPPPAPAEAAQVAEAVRSRSALATPLTEVGFVVGTPAYMAPEQISQGVSGDRSDQFSFGVTLYEALYGERPFGPERPADPEQWKVRDAPAGSPVPAWVRKVALRCLELKPEGRFASMREVLDALRADPDRGRRRLWVAAGVAFAVLASAGTAYGVVARRLRACAGVEQDLAGVWDDSQREAVRAAFAAVNKPFAADAARAAARQLDGYAAAWAQMRRQACEATRVRGEAPESVLALRLSCLDRRLESLSALVAVLRAADAAVAQKAIDATAGLPSLDACADLAALTALVPPPQDAAVRAKVEDLRKRLARPKAQLLAAQFKQGLEPAKAAAAEAVALGYPPLVADAQELLGRMEDGAADFKGAERAFAAAAQAAQAGRDDELGARAWSQLALEAGIRQARWDAAHDALGMGKATLARLGGRDALKAELRLTEARLDLAEGKYQDGLAASQEALELYRRLYGEDRVETANAQYFVGQCLFRLGKLDPAIDADRKALAIRRQVLGPDHPETANAIHGLATALQMAGRFDEALPLHLQSLSIRERSLGPEHPDLAFSLNNLTALFATQRKFKDAVPYAERTLKLQQAVYGQEHPLVATALHNLGALHGDMKEYDRSLELLDQAAKMRVKLLGPEHPEVAQTYVTMSQVLMEQGKLKEALDAGQRALAIREKVLPPGHRDTAGAQMAVGLVELRMGRAADALVLAEKVLKLREESKNIPAGDLADVRYFTARALWEAGQDKGRARKLLQAAEAAYGEQKFQDRLEDVAKWKKAHHF